MILSLISRSLRGNLIVNNASLLSTANLLPRVNSLLLPIDGDQFNQTRAYAARKGTRIKRALEARRRALARKSQPKVMKKRITFEAKAKAQVMRSDPAGKPLPPDDVYYTESFIVPSYSLSEAIKLHREAHSPTILNLSSSLLFTRIELYMKAKKKTKFQDSFSSTVTLPHKFPFPRRNRVIAVIKGVEEQEAAKAAGAILAGADDLIRNIKSGLISQLDYEHLVCHTDMLIPLTAVRGVLNDRFPSKTKGNYGNDILALVKKFTEGYDYTAAKNLSQENFGYIDLPIGTLEMKDEQIAENLLALLEDAERCRADDAPGQFPETVWLISPESQEKFKIKFWELNDKYTDIFSSEKFKDQVDAIIKTIPKPSESKPFKRTS